MIPRPSATRPIFEIPKTNGIVALSSPPATPPPLTVTVSRAAGQASPTKWPVVEFDIVFSEPVTGFDATGPSQTDATLTASTGYALTSSLIGTGPDYLLRVKYVNPPHPADLNNSIFEASILEGVAASVERGLPNEASIDIDNTVEYVTDFERAADNILITTSRAYYGLVKIGDHLFIPESNGHRLISVDVSDNYATTISQTLTPIPGGSVNAVNPRAIATDGTQVFLLSTSQLRVVNVSNPSAMTITGTTVNDGTLTTGDAVLIYDDGYCYAGYTGGRITVVDVSSPSLPAVVTSLVDVQLAWIRTIVKIGDNLFCLCSHNDLTSASIVTVDVSNPGAPSIAAVFPLDPDDFGNRSSMVLLGSHHLVLAYDGFRIIDASDPTDLAVVGSFSIEIPAGNFVQGSSFQGVAVWDATTVVTLAGGLMYGPFLIDVTDVTDPQLISASLNLTTTLPSGAMITDGTAVYHVAQSNNGLEIMEYIGP